MLLCQLSCGVKRPPFTPHWAKRGLKWSESHLENLMLLHTYLRLHKARQNVVRQRLIGSQLVSAPFVVSVSAGNGENTRSEL